MAQLKTYRMKQLREWRKGYYKEEPTEFKAIKIKVDGEDRIHILGAFDTEDTFVRGKGHVKLGKRKILTIPVWDGDTATIQQYIADHGRAALFRSLTLADLSSNDCTDYNAQLEFASFILYGLSDMEKWNKFQTLYEKFLELERKAVEERLMRKDWFINFHLEHNSLRPTFSTMGIVMPPNVCILNAEKHLKELAFEELSQRELEGLADPKEHAKTREEILAWFDCHSIPQMVERYYGKEASDLYNELEEMYGEDAFDDEIEAEKA